MRVDVASCSKRYGERVALRRVDLAAAPGEVVLLLGANGSGKSTLLRLVAGLVRPSAGQALLDGVPSIDAPAALRRRVGYVGHRALVYRDLSARENLRLTARLFRVPAAGIEPALASVGLAGREDDHVGGFSRGMLQRLAIARALLPDPDLLLLDEPSTGLDAEGRALLESVLAAGRGRRTVLAATHDPDVLGPLADRAVTLARGEVVAT